MSLPVFVHPLDWKAIRSLSGAQHKGFEELCVQLARSEIPSQCQVTRNGTPDGGVECYATFDSGDEWGWQSKYVHSVEDSQWSQISDSVKTALATHPKLTRYHVCAPLDLPDARQGRKKSARDRWKEHQTKWSAWAAKRQMNVEFVWWGSSELLDLLSLPDNAGRVMFWFGSPGCFNRPWFEAQVARATKNAGPRYTPELHVELPISQQFEAFGRTAGMINRVRGTGRGLHQEYKHVADWTNSDETPGLGTACQPLKAAVDTLMALLNRFREQPSGKQGLVEISAAATQALRSIDAVDRGLDSIDEHWRSLHHPEDHPAKRDSRQRAELQTHRRRSIRDFEYELRSAIEVYSAEEAFAEAQVLVLTGEAGAGKTHLFCDIAKQRIADNRPTVLLLGQTFTTTESPARQIASLLGLPNASLNEIVGCLEAAAQAANARCLILIDALNEGMGRQFWKPHLTAFLETIKASPWLAVAVSVRTCYVDALIPKAVWEEAALATHQGFDDAEHEAIKFFFLAHGLEFASAPVFSQEFSNPLFLKTLCSGLQKSGYRRLPRGFHGITKVFELYLEALESELAERLDYARSQKLVRKALHALVSEAAKANQQFLSVDQGREVVDRHLPGRNYSESLYKAILDSGLLMENPSYGASAAACDTVCIAYERWTDHVAAKSLLDEHLDPARPSEAFKIGGPLALYGEDFSMRAGIREALSIQVPERVGRELLSLAPYGLRECGMADAFLKSVVWREPAACTPAMEALLNYIEAHELSDYTNVWDVRITIATVPGHALNMLAMDAHLRRIPMPDRDAHWTIAIHRAWDQQHSICHLVDWAWRLEKGGPLEEDSAWLAALTLCWCFTSSHRFLRDRATKAAVNLLDGRVDLVARLVKHFAEVDDLYVRERVLAVACGVAMRSRDAHRVTELAEAVYQTVFASGTPPAHILIRDYSRCVIERAVHLGGQVSFDPNVSKAPYHSKWPTIPSAEEIEAMKTDWQEIGKTRSDDEWARHSIIHSVQEDDFARYVIGTNHWSTDWLSLRMDDPPWVPLSLQIDELIETLTGEQQAQWEEIERLRDVRPSSHNYYLALARGEKAPPMPEEQVRAMLEKEDMRSKQLHALTERLETSLTPEARERLSTLIKEREKSVGDRPPRFDLSLIQRYIIKRVFELGWTVERFGWFDRHEGRSRGREASKPERIGKKYQWIAYHEISALVADHFQFRKDRWGNRAESYEGPWQDWFRDLDPTHGIKALPERTNSRGAWWETVRYDNWESERNGRDWAVDASDFPELSQLLLVTDHQSLRWINAWGHFSWDRERLPSQGYNDGEKRNVWTNFHAWLVKRGDSNLLLDWLGRIDVGNKWMPHQLPHETQVFLGEHSWARASLFHECAYYGYDGWHHKGECPVEVFSIPVEYLEERSTFDCSMDESFTLLLPTSELVRELGLRWTGNGADFITPKGELFATDPSAHEPGRHCLLLREDLLWRYLDDNGLSLVWAVSGEKNYYGPRRSHEDFFGLRFSGAFELTRDGVRGKVRHYDQKEWAAKEH